MFSTQVASMADMDEIPCMEVVYLAVPWKHLGRLTAYSAPSLPLKGKSRTGLRELVRQFFKASQVSPICSQI